MSTENLILLARDGWRQLRDGALVEIPEWPTLEEPTIVVTDFEEAPMGTYRFDGGKATYAVPMIEKRARAEGLTDGLAHILVHRVLVLGGGFQTFHTAVPLEFWQRLQQWAAQQRDHCILIPLGALLSAGIRVGHARVLQIGRTLHYFGESKTGLHYASVNAIGRFEDDLLAAVRVLAGSVQGENANGVDRSVVWGSVLSSEPGQEARLLARWNQLVDVPTSSMPATEWQTPTGSVTSALPPLVARAGIRASVNPPLARLAWWSERLVAGVATTAGILALGLVGLGLFAQAQSQHDRHAAEESRRTAQALETRVAAINRMEPAQGFAPVADLARKLGEAARYDPVPMLGLLRDAAGTDIRIQRLRLDSNGNQERAFQVDGVAQDGGVESIGRLLARLRAAGWSAQAINPIDTAPGAFSYRLTALAATRS